MYRILGSLVLLLAMACAAAEPALPPPPAARSVTELRAQLEAVLREHHIPGMSIAIVHRDGPEWVDGVGLADVATHAPATAATLFRIGSTSKAFTSLALLQLVNEGKLSLQDPVRRLVPDVWFENPWEQTDPVRVVDLLEHTTGWDDMHLREYAKDAAGMSLSEGLDYDHHSRTSRWRPGTRMAYCNSGLGVAGAIVEKVSGQRFEDYIAGHLFGPIGMKTATYLPPHGVPVTTLYHGDGRTPFPYWNILIRPAGAINASAADMAAYVQFYLNRGRAAGVEVVPAASIERMESPTRTWQAQAGLKAGYGLSNYWTVADGFVYHGHDGGVSGGLTEMAYLPEDGVGYSFSINSGNGAGFAAVAKLIRAYVTRDLVRPALPPAAPLPAAAADYAGWYQPDSPRTQMFAFMERLLGLTHVAIEGQGLVLTGLDRKARHYVPVAASQFRANDAPDHLDPVASLALVAPNAEGRFIATVVGAEGTLRQIPAWLALAQIALAAWFVLAVASVVLYAPFWLVGGLLAKRRRPAERALRVLPLCAVLAVVGIALGVGDDLITALGSATPWSVTLFLATIAFAVASLGSALAAWRAPASGVRRAVRVHAWVVAPILVVATAYFAYWGVIGLRTWS